MIEEKTQSVGVTYSHITKVFGNKTVVDDFSMEINPGEYVIFLGPSGCGKTTMLRMLAGLEQPTSGEIYINGEPLTNVAPKDRNIAMVFQNYALYPHMTIKENLSFPLEAKKIPKEEINRRIEEVTEILKISEHWDKKPSQLSGGEAQRVALGRALIRKPAVFLMDEPLSNLDAKLRNDMREEFLRLHQRLKITTIYVTHDQEEAMALADRIVLFNKGKVQQIGKPQDVYDKPNNKFVAEFLGNPRINMIKGILHPDGHFTVINENGTKTDIETDFGELRNVAHEPREVWLGVRPEDIVFDKTRPATDFCTVKIEITEPMGRESRIGCTIGGWRTIFIDPGRNSVKMGETINLGIAKGKLHIYDAKTEDRLN